MKFHGVGPKTAAIVLQFSLNKPAFPVDTHIYRVSGRIGLRPAKMTVEQAHAHLESLLPPATYYAAHLNLIRLGREICHAAKTQLPGVPSEAPVRVRAENRGAQQEDTRDSGEAPGARVKEVTRAEEELTQLGIPHRTFRHAGKVASLEQAARRAWAKA